MLLALVRSVVTATLSIFLVNAALPAPAHAEGQMPPGTWIEVYKKEWERPGKKIDSKFVVSRVGLIKSWVDVRSIVRRGDYAFFNFLEFILTDPVNTNKPLNGTPVPIGITVNCSTQQLKHPVYNDPIFVGKDKSTTGLGIAAAIACE